jgi:hypothetical protein
MPFLINIAHLVMAAMSVDDVNLHHTQGLEFSVLDAFAIALYLSAPRERYALPFRLGMVLYFVAVVASIFQSFQPDFSLFYSWQLLRMFLVYAVVARGCADMRVVTAILQGMAIGLLFQVPFSVIERFGYGVLQASGTFEHQNILGLVSHFVVFPFFAAFLDGFWGALPTLVVLSGVIVEVLTTSRATLGLAALGYLATYALSALGSLSSRKLTILGAAILMLVVVVPVAISSFETRGEIEMEASNDTRRSMEHAAELMLADYPFGVGANTYIQRANIGGYNAGADVDITSWVIFVHNAYLIVAAETGYLGVITFVIMLLRPTFVAFFCGFRNKRDRRGILLLGLGVAFLIVEIHGLFEWVMLKAITQYFFAIEFGMVAGLTRQLGYWRQPIGQKTAALMASGRLKQHARKSNG